MSYSITYFNPLDEEIQEDQLPQSSEVRAGSSRDVLNVLYQQREKPSHLHRKMEDDEKGQI